MEINLPGVALDKAAAGVIEKLFGSAADGIADATGNIFGGLIGDRLREWRKRNLIATLAKTAEYLREMNIPLEKARALPMGDVYAIFEGASKQEEPDVCEMWAALLGNAMNYSGDVRASPAIVDNLKAFTSKEANAIRVIGEISDILNEIYGYPAIIKNNINGQSRNFHSFHEMVAKFADAKNIEIKKIIEYYVSSENYKQIDFTLSHLMSKGLIAYSGRKLQLSDDILKVEADHSRGEVVQVVDARAIKNNFRAIDFLISQNSGIYTKPYELISIEMGGRFKLNYNLTPFGRGLLEACTIRESQVKS
jgi:hypothetical protein